MSRWKNKGFTLLEVMLAVTILSVGLVLVLRSYVSSLRAIKVAHNFLVANLLLEEKIWQKQEERMRAGEIIAEDGQDAFAAPFDNFSYKIGFEEEEEMPLLYKSTLEVFWKQKKEERDISCVTYLNKSK